MPNPSNVRDNIKMFITSMLASTNANAGLNINTCPGQVATSVGQVATSVGQVATSVGQVHHPGHLSHYCSF